VNSLAARPILTVFVLSASLLFAILPHSTAAIESPQPQWTKDFAGYWANQLVQTSEGGYAILGFNLTQNSRGENITVALLLKTESTGRLQWAKTYGPESGVDGGVLAVVQTSDSGFALCSNSAKGWLLKTDSEGNLEWNKTLNVEAGYADFTSLSQTSDRGFALTYQGWFWNMSGFGGILKTDENGNTVWTTIYATQTAKLASVAANFALPTSDEGYALAGAWSGDSWFGKTDSEGKLELNKTYEYGSFESMLEAKDGGYVLSGFSGDGDGWLMKVDSEGNLLWKQTFARTARLFTINSAKETSDGGYIAVGYSVAGNGLSHFALFARTDSSGNLVWNMTYEGKSPSSVVITSDEGFAMVGSSADSIWLEKFTSALSPDESSFSTMMIATTAFAVAAVVAAVAVVYLKKRKPTTLQQTDSPL
jgi:hypothetical protein